MLVRLGISKWEIKRSAGLLAILMLGATVGAADTGSGTTQLDGETHPFGIGPSVGFSGTGSNPTTLPTAEYIETYHSISHSLNSTGEGLSLESNKRLSRDLVESLSKLARASRSPRTRELLEKAIKYVKENWVEGSGPTNPTKRVLVTLLRQIFVYDLGFVAGQVGFSSTSQSNVGYGSLYFAGPELGLDPETNSRFAVGLSGLVLPTLSAGPKSVTYRLGADVLFGHPDRAIVTASVGEYLNPNIHDLSISFSRRLGGENIGVDEIHSDADGQTDRTYTPRRLFDHVRPGDVWTDLQFRSLSSQISGQAVEAGFTYCLPFRQGIEGYPDLAPSISATFTYCEQHELGVNEGGLELRIPLKLETLRTPIYLTGRYGTRGNGSVGIAFKF